MNTKIEINTGHEVPQPAGKIVADWYRENQPSVSEILHALAHALGNGKEDA